MKQKFNKLSINSIIKNNKSKIKIIYLLRKLISKIEKINKE